MIDWLACTLVRAIGALLCHLPPSVAVWCGERLGALAYWLQPKRARIGMLNLRAAFDGRITIPEARRIIAACFWQLGAGIIELLRLPVIDQAYLERYITIKGRQHIEEAAASGRPVVLLTGHYGNWELSSIVAALMGYPIVALARAQKKFPRLYRLLVSYRESKGCTVVHKGGTMKRLIAAIDEGRMVGIVGDQASRQGIFVDFFGRPALFARGPFELAYRKHAIVLPAFIHRVRGPYHRIVVEPPLTLPWEAPESEVVRQGIEQFAHLLARHIVEEPSQWLWMHKRWKHTPSRRCLVLSDGKAGHLKQSLALVEAVRERRPDVSHDVLDVRYRSRLARALAVAWSWWVPAGLGADWCLAWTLAPQSAAALRRRYADLIISCGASTAPANLLWARANHAKAVILMNPAPLPLRRFHLVIAPLHDQLPQRRNVVHTTGAINRMTDAELQQASVRLRSHPQFKAALAPPVIGVFIGGDTHHYALTTAFTQALIEQVLTACEALDGRCLVTTSRRTSPAVEYWLAQRLGAHPRCPLLLIASRDPLNGTMSGMLGSADVAVVTGESISMVSEACAAGRPVVVVEPPLRGRSTVTKHQRFLRGLATEACVSIVPIPDVALALQRALTQRQSTKRLDSLAPARKAVIQLLGLPSPV